MWVVLSWLQIKKKGYTCRLGLARGGGACLEIGVCCPSFESPRESRSVQLSGGRLVRVKLQPILEKPEGAQKPRGVNNQTRRSLTTDGGKVWSLTPARTKPGGGGGARRDKKQPPKKKKQKRKNAIGEGLCPSSGGIVIIRAGGAVVKKELKKVVGKTGSARKGAGSCLTCW